MAMQVIIRVDRKAIKAYKNDPTSDVGRYMRGLGRRVENRAKILCPVDNGALRTSIRSRARRGNNIWVGSNLNYAAAVETGSGLYGPKRTPIRPRTATYMTWVSKVPPWTGQRIFVKSTRGQRPQPYLVPAMVAVVTGR